MEGGAVRLRRPLRLGGSSAAALSALGGSNSLGRSSLPRPQLSSSAAALFLGGSSLPRRQLSSSAAALFLLGSSLPRQRSSSASPRQLSSTAFAALFLTQQLSSSHLAPRSAVPRSAVPRSAVPRSAVPRSAVPRSAVPRSAVRTGSAAHPYAVHRSLGSQCALCICSRPRVTALCAHDSASENENDLCGLCSASAKKYFPAV
jgi:hypothetical protein